MPAPTAPLRKYEDVVMDAVNVPLPAEDNDAELIDMNISTSTMADMPVGAAVEDNSDTPMTDGADRPSFPPTQSIPLAFRREKRAVPIPPHRLTPLKSSWPKIYVRSSVPTKRRSKDMTYGITYAQQPPLVEHLKLQVRMNPASKCVELRTSKSTTDTGALQKGEDFVKCFTLGFDVDDAIALLRLDDLYIETFEIKDVKSLQGEHLGRAIGRIAGKDGKTKFAIENASRTRVVLADSKIHILGGFKNIHIARESIVSLILGQNPSKVYGNLRTIAGRMKERF